MLFGFYCNLHRPELYSASVVRAWESNIPAQQQALNVSSYSMTYKPTLLNIVAGSFLIGVFGYATWNYKTLSEGEGWGVVAMFGLPGVGVLVGLTDLILQQLIKNTKVLNVVGLFIVIGWQLRF